VNSGHDDPLAEDWLSDDTASAARGILGG
jgi:hypothetical protein